MLTFTCDNPGCNKRTHVRHGYSFVPDQHSRVEAALQEAV